MANRRYIVWTEGEYDSEHASVFAAFAAARDCATERGAPAEVRRYESEDDTDGVHVATLQPTNPRSVLF